MHLSSWQQQLQALLETLSHTEPHYVRCVKPNNVLKPNIFENQNILQQLRCGVSNNFTTYALLIIFLFIKKKHEFQGVMEAIRISCAGFPTRKPFHEFIERFEILSPDVVHMRY